MSKYNCISASYSKFIQRRKDDYSRAGVEVIVIPLAKLPEDVRDREKALGEYVWE